MADHLLNNVRDLLNAYAGESRVSVSLNVFGISDAAACEVLGHLHNGWGWTPGSANESNQWITGKHESGVQIVLFLESPPRSPDTTARGKAIIDNANGTYDSSAERP